MADKSVPLAESGPDAQQAPSFHVGEPENVEVVVNPMFSAGPDSETASRRGSATPELTTQNSAELDCSGAAEDLQAEPARSDMSDRCAQGCAQALSHSIVT